MYTHGHCIVTRRYKLMRYMPKVNSGQSYIYRIRPQISYVSHSQALAYDSLDKYDIFIFQF